MAEGIRRQTEMENFFFIPNSKERTCRVKEEKQGPVSYVHGVCWKDQLTPNLNSVQGY